MSSQTYSYHSRSPTTTATGAHRRNSGNHNDTERSLDVRESKMTTLSSSDRGSGVAAAGVAASSSSYPSHHYHYHGPTSHGNGEQMEPRSTHGWAGGESSKPSRSKKRRHSHRPRHHKHTASGSFSLSGSSFVSEEDNSVSSSLEASHDHRHGHHHHHYSRQPPSPSSSAPVGGPIPPLFPPLPGHSTHLQNQEQQASLQRQIEQIQQQQRKLEKKQKEKERKQENRRHRRRSSGVLTSEDSITITHRVVRSSGNEETGAPRGKKGSDTAMGGISPGSSMSSSSVSGGAAAGGSDTTKKRHEKRKKKDHEKGRGKTRGKADDDTEEEEEEEDGWKKKKKKGALGTEAERGMTHHHYSRHRPGSGNRRRRSSTMEMSTSETLSPTASGSPLSNVVTTTTTLTMRVTPSPKLGEEDDSYDENDNEKKKKKKRKQPRKLPEDKKKNNKRKRPGSGGRRRSSGSHRGGSGPQSHPHRHHYHSHRSRSHSSSSCMGPSSSTVTPGSSQTLSVHTDTSASASLSASLSASTPQSSTLQTGPAPTAPPLLPYHSHHHHPHHHHHRSSSSASFSHGDHQRSSQTVDIHQSQEESSNTLLGDSGREPKKDGGKGKQNRKGKKKRCPGDRAKGEANDSPSRRRRREGGNSGRHHSRRRHRHSSAGSLVEEETTVTISKTEVKPISTVLTSMDRLRKEDSQFYSQTIGGDGGAASKEPTTIVITKDQQERRQREHSKPSSSKSPSKTSSPRSYAVPTTPAPPLSTAASPSAAGAGTPPSHPGVQGQYVHDVDMEAANKQKMHNLKLKAACLAHEDYIFDLHAPSWAETQQQKLDAAHDKAAQLLAALERGDKWQITEPFELSRLMRLCNLELSFHDLNKPNDKPQYLEILALRKALGELRQHPKKTSGVSLVGTIDHALNKLEHAEEELRRSQWNAVPLGRAALPVVKGLEDCLNTPLVDRSLEANEDRIAAQLDAIKASTKLRDAALADGEMGIAEEQYYVKGQLLEHLLELIKDKFRILGENESRNNMMPNMEDTRRHAANEIANIRAGNRRLQERCEDDLKNLLHAIHTADIADAEAAKEYVSKRDGSEQALTNNLKRQSDLWKKMHELERALQLLGEERLEEVKRRIDAHDREEKRHVEYQQFLDVCDQHKGVLELTMYNCEIGNRCAALIEEMISETCKNVQSRMDKMNEEIADLRLQVHIEYLEAFRRLYKTFGQLMYKKEKRLEEIDRQIRTTHIQLEFAIETFDPNAKKHSDAKKELHQLRAHVEGELELLKEKVSQSLDNFAPTEDALHQAGIKFKHPVDEVEDINLSRRSKMVEYRAHLAKQEEERINAEREEIKRAKKIHGDNQRSRGVLQIT